MSLWDKVKGSLVGFGVGADRMTTLSRHLEAETFRATETPEMPLSLSKEVDANLQQLELGLDEVGWNELLASPGSWNFTRGALRKMMALSRVMFIANPLIKRAVIVQQLYVWGQGVHIGAEDPTVQEVLDDFHKDEANQRTIGISWPDRETEQRIDGNTFFVLYRNKRTGAARIRTFPVDRIARVVCNPQDRTEPWFYLVSPIEEESIDYLNGAINPPEIPGKPEAYPAIDYSPSSKPKVIQTVDFKDVPVNWDRPILHVKSGGLPSMYYGLPELFSTFNYATAYKGILANFATMMKAYARIAMNVSGLAGDKGRAATKKGLQTGVGTAKFRDDNAPNAPGGWALLSGNAKIEAVKTSNMTTAPDVARPIRSMVAAGSDTPEHFFGDSDIGNFATSSTLDRPTELKMVQRQNMWAAVIGQLNRKVILWSVQAPEGKLRNAGFKVNTTNRLFDGELTVTVTPPEGKNLNVAVGFPNILERDVTDRVRAVVMAATLGGRPAEGIFPDRGFLFKLLVIALGEKHADALMKKYYPSEVKQGFVDPTDRMKNENLTAVGRKELGDAALKQADAAMKNATKPVPKVTKPNGADQPTN